MHTSRSLLDESLRLFPPPRFLAMPGVGIDISEGAVKYIGLAEKTHGITIPLYGKATLPKGIVADSEIKDTEQLTAFLKKLRRDKGFEFAHVSLPEEHAYVFQTDVPEDSTPAQIQTVIEFQMKENVPLSPAEALFDYELLPHFPAPAGTKKISVAVYPNKVVADYLAVLRGAGITPLSIEIEGGASARALISLDAVTTVIVVDIGRTKAGISIVGAGKILFTATLEIGGNDLTEAIQKDTGLSYEEAEELKRDRGFLKGKDSVSGALLSAMSVLRDEILRHALYWKEHPMHDGEGDTVKGIRPGNIEKVILCGGNANIVGIAEYMSASLKMPVERGNVWTNVQFTKEYVPEISERDSLEYATALGLALRSLRNQRTC